MAKARFMNKIPKKLVKQFWPTKLHSTIDEAAKWFKKEFGKLPEIVVAESFHYDVVQDVSMWRKDAAPNYGDYRYAQDARKRPLQVAKQSAH